MSVSLAKGQSVSLTTGDGSSMTHVRIAPGWDAVRKGLFGSFRGADVDMDASAILYDAAGTHVDHAWFRQLKSRDGAVVHTGDNRTGAGEGDDESIIVHLDRVPAEVAQIVFTINSSPDRASPRSRTLLPPGRREHPHRDRPLRREPDRPAHRGDHGQSRRQDGGWAMTALGEIGNGRTFQDLLPSIAPTLDRSDCVDRGQPSEPTPTTVRPAPRTVTPSAARIGVTFAATWR